MSHDKQPSTITKSEEIRKHFDSIPIIHTENKEKILLEIRKYEQHKIELIECDTPLNTFNCHAYAVGIYDNEKYQDLVYEYLDSALLNSSFIHEYYDCLFYEKKESEVEVGSLISYWEGDKIKHTGIISDINEKQMIINSKWGTSHIFRHGKWDIPLSYGSDIKILKIKASNCYIIRLLKGDS